MHLFVRGTRKTKNLLHLFDDVKIIICSITCRRTGEPDRILHEKETEHHPSKTYSDTSCSPQIHTFLTVQVPYHCDNTVFLQVPQRHCVLCKCNDEVKTVLPIVSVLERGLSLKTQQACRRHNNHRNQSKSHRRATKRQNRIVVLVQAIHIQPHIQIDRSLPFRCIPQFHYNRTSTTTMTRRRQLQDPLWNKDGIR